MTELRLELLLLAPLLLLEADATDDDTLVLLIILLSFFFAFFHSSLTDELVRNISTGGDGMTMSRTGVCVCVCVSKRSKSAHLSIYLVAKTNPGIIAIADAAKFATIKIGTLGVVSGSEGQLLLFIASLYWLW